MSHGKIDAARGLPDSARAAWEAGITGARFTMGRGHRQNSFAQAKMFYLRVTHKSHPDSPAATVTAANISPSSAIYRETARHQPEILRKATSEIPAASFISLLAF